MNLSLRQLQTFVMVMRSRSVSEAARTLGRSQPAVSAMIAGLEEEVGFPLFERDRGRLVPRPEAYYFLEEAEFVLSRIHQSARTLQEIGNLEKGTLKIVCSPASSNYFMPKVLAEFLKDKPNIQVSLQMRSSNVVIDWIASQQYDVGFGEYLETRNTIETKHFAFPTVCAMPKGDPLASKRSISPADLSGYPMAMLYDEHRLSVRIREEFHEAGAELNRQFEVRTFQSALQLVSAGVCYLLCDAFSAGSHVRSFGHLSKVTFQPFVPHIDFYVSLMIPANRSLSMVAQAFAQSVEHEVLEMIDNVHSFMSE